MTWKSGIMAFLILACALAAPSFAAAQSIDASWADDFEDGALKEWYTTRGYFEESNGILWAYGTDSWASNRISHESTVEYGRWSFDIFLKEDWIWRYHPPSIRFIVDSLDDIEWNGYSLELHTHRQSSEPTLALYLRRHTEVWKTLAYYEHTRSVNGWQSVEISRDVHGHIRVLLNNTMVIRTQDTSIKESKHFIFDTEDCAITRFEPSVHQDVFVQAQEGPSLDNLVVQDIKSNLVNPAAVVQYTTASIICALIVGCILCSELWASPDRTRNL